MEAKWKVEEVEAAAVSGEGFLMVPVNLAEKRWPFYKEGFFALSYRGQGKKSSPEFLFLISVAKIIADYARRIQ